MIIKLNYTIWNLWLFVPQHKGYFFPPYQIIFHSFSFRTFSTRWHSKHCAVLSGFLCAFRTLAYSSLGSRQYCFCKSHLLNPFLNICQTWWGSRMRMRLQINNVVFFQFRPVLTKQHWALECIKLSPQKTLTNSPPRVQSVAALFPHRADWLAPAWCSLHPVVREPATGGGRRMRDAASARISAQNRPQRREGRSSDSSVNLRKRCPRFLLYLEMPTWTC